ncbi:unnamed protein product [Rhodiola kirilowii]
MAPQTRQSSRSTGPASRPTEKLLRELKASSRPTEILESVELPNFPDGLSNHSIESVDWYISRPTGQHSISHIFNVSRPTGKISSRQSIDWSYSSGKP